MQGAQSLVAFAHGGVFLASLTSRPSASRRAMQSAPWRSSASARAIHTVWLKAPSAAGPPHRPSIPDQDAAPSPPNWCRPPGAAASQYGTPVDRQFFTGFNVQHGAAADFMMAGRRQ
jgi:hypothetical protein